MSFSFSPSPSQQIADLQSQQALYVAQKNNDRFKSDLEKQQQDRQSQDAIDNLTKSLTQQKALDAAKKAKANYDAGIVDPNDAAKEAIDKKSALDKATESGMTDFQKYSQKNDYDLGNQKKAWESANMFRMKEADQSNVAQKDRLDAQLGNQRTMQQATIDQANKLRSDDNQRAIAGYKGNF